MTSQGVLEPKDLVSVTLALTLPSYHHLITMILTRTSQQRAPLGGLGHSLPLVIFQQRVQGTGLGPLHERPSEED